MGPSPKPSGCAKQNYEFDLEQNRNSEVSGSDMTPVDCVWIRYAEMYLSKAKPRATALLEEWHARSSDAYRTLHRAQFVMPL